MPLEPARSRPRSPEFRSRASGAESGRRRTSGGSLPSSTRTWRCSRSSSFSRSLTRDATLYCARSKRIMIILGVILYVS
jgi:hypothetical protein